MRSIRAMRRMLIAFGFLLIVSLSAGQQTYCPENSACPTQGFIPDEATAVAVGEAILTPIYGSRHIAGERPVKARLYENHWIVSGTLPRPKREGLVVVGGTATIELSKQDG